MSILQAALADAPVVSLLCPSIDCGYDRVKTLYFYFKAIGEMNHYFN